MKRLLIALLVALPLCANAGYSYLGDFPTTNKVTINYLTTNGAGVPTYPATAPMVTISCDDGTTITERLARTAMTLRVAADVNTATHTGGTTTTFVDAALTGADDYIKNMRIKFDTGSNAGQEVKITGFVASTDTVTFSPAVPVNVATTDDYTIVDPRWHTKHTIAAADGDVCTVLMEDATDGGNPEIATYVVKAAAAAAGGTATTPDVLQTTTIATLASQTSFTLSAGSADDTAYVGGLIIIEDSVTATQKAFARIKSYTGATKTVVLETDPGVFTMATGDSVDIMATELTWGATQADNRVSGTQGRKQTDQR